MRLSTAVKIAAVIYLTGEDGKTFLHFALGHPIMQGVTLNDGRGIIVVGDRARIAYNTVIGAKGAGISVTGPRR